MVMTREDQEFMLMLGERFKSAADGARRLAVEYREMADEKDAQATHIEEAWGNKDWKGLQYLGVLTSGERKSIEMIIARDEEE